MHPAGFTLLEPAPEELFRGPTPATAPFAKRDASEDKMSTVMAAWEKVPYSPRRDTALKPDGAAPHWDQTHRGALMAPARLGRRYP